MTQALRAFSYGHGGLGVALFTLIAWLALPRLSRLDRRTELLLTWLGGIVVCAALLSELGLTACYLVSPAYLDHIEASVASTVHSFMAGAPLYPPLDSFTFNGLLYGPLLAELDSLGYVLPDGALSAKIMGWLAGWSAIAILILQIRSHARGAAGAAGLIYALALLLSFGADVTVARPEPLLLLFAALSLAVALRLEGAAGAILLGLLCGLAMGLKVHAPLYLLPSVYLWGTRHTLDQWRRQWLTLTTCFVGAGIIALILPFAPKNVAAADYLSYLTLAAKHGLSLDLFERNCAFMVGMWAPVLLLLGGFTELRRTSLAWRGFVLTLLGAECLVLVIASKPGAGIHHFLPFVVPHALLFRDLHVQTQSATGDRALLAVAVTVLGMITPTVQTQSYLLAFDLRLPEQIRQRDELLGFARRFPGGMIGVADDSSYELANFRPWLTARGIKQTDYGAFMDLQLSGVTDAPLSTAFAHCAIPFVYVPKTGEPFTLTSRYSTRPLFSDEVRDEFAAHYRRRDTGAYFDAFACQ